MSKTTVNGGNGKVYFKIDPTTGKAIFWQGDNVAAFDLRKAQGGDGAFLPVPKPGEDQTAASALMLEFRRLNGETKQPIHLEVALPSGEILLSFDAIAHRLSFDQHAEMGVLMGTRGVTYATLTTQGAQRVFWAALFVVGLTKTEDENEPYFASMEEAFNWMREPGMDDFVQTLCDVLTELNPRVKKNLAQGVGLANLLVE